MANARQRVANWKPESGVAAQQLYDACGELLLALLPAGMPTCSNDMKGTPCNDELTKAAPLAEACMTIDPRGAYFSQNDLADMIKLLLEKRPEALGHLQDIAKSEAVASGAEEQCTEVTIQQVAQRATCYYQFLLLLLLLYCILSP